MLLSLLCHSQDYVGISCKPYFTLDNNRNFFLFELIYMEFITIARLDVSDTV